MAYSQLLITVVISPVLNGFFIIAHPVAMNKHVLWCLNLSVTKRLEKDIKKLLAVFVTCVAVMFVKNSTATKSKIFKLFPVSALKDATVCKCYSPS